MITTLTLVIIDCSSCLHNLDMLVIIEKDWFSCNPFLILELLVFFGGKVLDFVSMIFFLNECKEGKW